MKKQTRVVVYGSTLYMAGIAASLKMHPEMDVVRVNPHSRGAQQRLVEIHPEALTFDLSDPNACVDVTLLRSCPGLLLIGVDPSSDELLVLSRESQQVLTVADLLDVIHKKEINSETFKGEKYEKNEKPKKENFKP